MTEETEVFHDRRPKLTPYQTKVLGHLSDTPHTSRTMAEKLHGDVILHAQQIRRAGAAMGELHKKGLAQSTAKGYVKR